jgi:CRISPR-associated protein Csm4
VKLYEFTIRPLSGFGTPLKADTLFGHFCWQAAYDKELLKGGLANWIDIYDSEPFAVFSSAWPKIQNASTFYAMKRPDLPLDFLYRFPAGTSRQKRIESRKENMRRKWMIVPENLSLSLESTEFVTESRLSEMAAGWGRPAGGDKRQTGHFAGLIAPLTQSHNSINRGTMTTGDAPFAPFSETSIFYAPGTKLAIFVLIDERALNAIKVQTALGRIGAFGFGRDASTGRGRFEVDGFREIALPILPSANACYTLGPSVPVPGAFSKYYFAPFVRFGKHGDRFASSKNPFKNPVVMADEGAVFFSSNRDVFRQPYLGRCVNGTSLTHEETVAQGYSIYLPLELETRDE